MSDSVLAALQQALAQEHRVVYGYGVLGGRLVGPMLASAQAAYAAHENRRDALSHLVRIAGATPAAPEAGYLPARPVTTPRDARALAAALEDACAAAYAAVLAVTTQASMRSAAAGWLRDAAVREIQWRVTLGPLSVAHAPPLPGLAPVTAPVSATPLPPTPG